MPESDGVRGTGHPSGSVSGRRHKACSGVYNLRMRELSEAGLHSPPGEDGVAWTEHLRTEDLSVGTYVIPAGGSDPQIPHTEDEIYVVAAGRGVLAGSDQQIEISPGSVLFVAAGEDHHFERVTEDLVLVVVFGPAEGSRT